MSVWRVSGSASHKPAAHSASAADPALQYLPVVQLLHTAFPADGWNLPTAQVSHGFAAFVENLPAAHSVSFVLPTGQYVPAAHSVCVEASLEQYHPALHFRSSIDATGQYEPLSQQQLPQVPASDDTVKHHLWSWSSVFMHSLYSFPLYVKGNLHGAPLLPALPPQVARLLLQVAFVVGLTHTEPAGQRPSVCAWTSVRC